MRDRGSSRVWTALAALLLAASLGLPWGLRQERVMDAGMPFTIQLWNGVGGGYCCLTTVPTYEFSSHLRTQVVTGAEHPARFGLVAALALLVFGGARLRKAAMACVVVAVLLSGGAGFTAGGVAAAWMSVLLLAAGAAGASRKAA